MILFQMGSVILMNKQGKDGIEWCDFTWNPVTGCNHGCSYCYAKGMYHRFNRSFEPMFNPKKLDEPAKKKKPSKIFVVSAGDLFGEWVPDEWIDEVFMKCQEVDRHSYLFLTKNPKRYDDAIEYLENEERGIGQNEGYWHNFWFGATITRQVDVIQAHELQSFSEGHKFLSIEPLLGPVEISRLLKWPVCKCWGPDGNPNEYGKYHWKKQALVSADWVGVEWVIIGQQTGIGAVPPKDEWVQSIIDQCRAAGVPVFVKSPLYEQFQIQEWPEGLR
jgi:protein gp37